MLSAWINQKYETACSLGGGYIAINDAVRPKTSIEYVTCEWQKTGR